MGIIVEEYFRSIQPKIDTFQKISEKFQSGFRRTICSQNCK